MAKLSIKELNELTFDEKNGTMDEIESMLKDQQHRLEVEKFATISGIKGRQFNKEIFSTVIKFGDLRDFIEAFNDVQRNLIVSKVNSIKNYVLSGLEKKQPMRFFPAITCTARGNIFYSEEEQRLAIDTNNSKLSVNDGQHRFMGVAEAIRTLEGKINRSKNEDEKSELKSLLRELNNMVLPIVIFNNLTVEEERQLFTDTNNLSQRPSRSSTIRLAQTDLYARMARDIVETNKYMKHYGVEMDKTSIYGKDNMNTLLLTTVYASIKTLIGKKLNETTYDAYKEFLNKTFDQMFRKLPADMDTKGKYITDQSYTIKGIAKFIAECKEREILDDVIFACFDHITWEADINFWKKYGAMVSKKGKLVFGGSGDHGRYAVYHALASNLPAGLRKSEQLELIGNE